MINGKNKRSINNRQNKKYSNSSNKIAFFAVVGLIVVAIAIMLFSFNSESPLKGKWFKGTWLYYDGQTSLTALETIIGSNCIAVFNDDGRTGYLDMMGGEIYDITYNRKTITIMGENIPYTLSDSGELSLKIPIPEEGAFSGARPVPNTSTKPTNDPNDGYVGITYQEQTGEIPPLSTKDDLKDWGL